MEAFWNLTIDSFSVIVAFIAVVHVVSIQIILLLSCPLFSYNKSIVIPKTRRRILRKIPAQLVLGFGRDFFLAPCDFCCCELVRDVEDKVSWQD